MNQERRPQIITGNWKMYKTSEEAHQFVQGLIPETEKALTLTYLAVPYTLIKTLSQFVKDAKIVLGAQNMNDASEGAFTGEIAGKMLVDAGARFVLLGHSERRRIFNESNEFINRKVKRALKENLQPVLCIGENKEEHDTNVTEQVLKQQIVEGLKGVAPQDLPSLILAYEPVWAIGTNHSADPDKVQQIHHFCRQTLAEISSPDIANKVVLQYGGSVQLGNAAQFLSQPDIDGLLIGGASLSLETFVKILHDSESVLNRKVESL